MTDLAYEVAGSGDPVLFIAGTGGAGRTWHIHQVPAFVAAGYRCITFDNRGIGATENTGGFSTVQMLADTIGLIEEVAGGPARVVGMSMGGFIAQELMLARPDLVTRAVLMGTRGRVDRTRENFRVAEQMLEDAGIELPPEYAAKVRVLENFSPRTINDETVIADWIDMFTAFPIKRTPGWEAQLTVSPRATGCRPTGRSRPRCWCSVSPTTSSPRPRWAARWPTPSPTAGIWRSPTPVTSAFSSSRRRSTRRCWSSSPIPACDNL